MTTFLLIRHGAHDLLGKVLAGRTPGVHLNARGKMEAEMLAEQLSAKRIAAIYTSPMERAQETAWPLADRLKLKAQVEGAFHEIDFGAWNGRTFSELTGQPAWQQWNEQRSLGQPPNGESMSAAQQRMVAGLKRLEEQHAGQTVAVFSHGDVIKAALMHYLQIPLDLIGRLEVHPASTSSVRLEQAFVQVMHVNVPPAGLGSLVLA